MFGQSRGHRQSKSGVESLNVEPASSPRAGDEKAGQCGENGSVPLGPLLPEGALPSSECGDLKARSSEK